MRKRGYGVLLVVVFLLGLCAPALAASLLRGEVRDAVTGEPIVGAVITCGAESALSGADGRFAIEGAVGLIRARAPGYRRFSEGVRPIREGAGEIRLTPFSPRALYLSYYGVAEPLLRDPAMELIEKTDLNALVIDIKGDTGALPYPSAIARAEEIGAQRVITLRRPRKMLTSLKKRGIYTIARIVTFKDDLLARARPELAVRDDEGNVWSDGMGLAWTDPFSPEVREYNLRVAEEAARMGFDEIQFDYIRFPEPSGQRYRQENNLPNRVEAIADFLAEARRRLEPFNVFLSADIFGYVCWNADDTQIGQQLEEMAKHLDYISPMLYPSGFSHGVGRYRDPVAHPAKVVLLSLKRARQRTGLAPVRFRPWLQAFRDYAFDRRTFGESEIRSQIEAAERFGSGGWMLWNARNVYTAAGLDRFGTEKGRAVAVAGRKGEEPGIPVSRRFPAIRFLGGAPEDLEAGALYGSPKGPGRGLSLLVESREEFLAALSLSGSFRAGGGGVLGGSGG